MGTSSTDGKGPQFRAYNVGRSPRAGTTWLPPFVGWHLRRRPCATQTHTATLADQRVARCYHGPGAAREGGSRGRGAGAADRGPAETARRRGRRGEALDTPNGRADHWFWVRQPPESPPEEETAHPSEGPRPPPTANKRASTLATIWEDTLADNEHARGRIGAPKRWSRTPPYRQQACKHPCDDRREPEGQQQACPKGEQAKLQSLCLPGMAG